MMRFCFLSFLLSATFGNPIQKGSTEENTQIYRVYPKTEEQVKFIADLNGRVIADLKDLNVLSPHSTATKKCKFADVLVPASLRKSFVSTLDKREMKYNVTVDNLQKLINGERNTKQFKSAGGTFKLNVYHSHASINAYLSKLQIEYPTIVKLVNFGKTHENRTLWAIKIGKCKNGTQKPEMYIDAGIHAREWLSISTAVYMISQLVTKYHNDTTIRQLVDSVDFYILPVVNPDGYEFTRIRGSANGLPNRMWRKNRSPNVGSCAGVDLNRNFPLNFGGAGTSSDPCMEIYKGSKALSELETTAVADFITKHKSSLKAYVALHCFSQFWMVPFGDFESPSRRPTDYDELEKLAKEAAVAVQKVNNRAYVVGNSADMLGAAAGASDDWAKGVAEIKFVYTVELMPDGSASSGFIVTENNILPTGREIFEGIKVVAKKVSKM